MHAFTHTLAHRAPSATRPRVRWQPYNPLSSQSSSSSSIRSPTTTQFSTPSSSISSPPSSTLLPESKLSHTQNQKEAPPPRDTKKQFAVGLVDQAVKTLGEIWRPQDIPPPFLITLRTGAATCGSEEHQFSSQPTQSSASSTSAKANDVRSTVPIKGFVHEVIRRSRTSGCVLQTALCYLEAIRPKIPDLINREKSGVGVRGDADISSRILPATEAELRLEEEYCLLEKSGMEYSTIAPSADLVSTVRLADVQVPDVTLDSVLDSSSKASQQVLPEDSLLTASTLPSPLLCPRRTFLASLILASKFTQDKCYSNRAWAKLSGLPARELSRCERALGEALDWRLWVGKTPVQSSSVNGSPSVGVAASSNRPVVRSQSESNLLSTPATRSPFLVRHDSRPSSAISNPSRLLHRSSTLPAEFFASSRTGALGCRNTQELSEPFGTTSNPSLIYADGLSQSPSPDNPGLSYSPSSTESSSGDRTIQMSTFFDEPMLHSAPQISTAPEFWSGPETCDLQEFRIQEFRISSPACPKNNQVEKALMASNHPNLVALPPAVAGVDFVANTYAPPTTHLSWLLDGETVRSLVAQ